MHVSFSFLSAFLRGISERRTLGLVKAAGLVTWGLLGASCGSVEERDNGLGSATVATGSGAGAATSASAGAATTSGPVTSQVPSGAASSPPVSNTGSPMMSTGTQANSAASTSPVPTSEATSAASVAMTASSIMNSAEPMPSSVPTTDMSTPQVVDGPPNPSGLAEPGEGGIAQPSGAAGNLTVLPWAGFAGAISYSFDDANSTQINNEEQLMGLEVPITWYLQTGKSEAGNAFYQRALDAGHELGNHTQSHGTGAADADVNQAQAFLMTEFGVTAYTMAAPNGNNGNYNTITEQLFILDRGVNDALIGPDDNTNMANLPSWIPPNNAGTAQFNPKVDAAVSQGKWQTVCIHGFTGGSDGAYLPISLTGFVESVEYAKTKDIWIGTMLDVGAYFLGRKLVKASMPQAMSGAQVYTWDLPGVFPPGKYVRVTVDGGTLSQDGKTLPWNDHGFYEVALDAGSLTISP